MGSVVRPRTIETIDGKGVTIPDPDRIVHLQLRRFAGCPFCNLHLNTLAAGADRLEAAGVREVVVLHSTARSLRKYAPELPFAIVPDPRKKLYGEFGVGSSLRSELDPRAWMPGARALLARRSLGMDPRGGILGLPGDFLIGSDGTILDGQVGEHAYDQWSLEEILSRAAAASN